MKEYILSHTALNQAELSRQIGWYPQHFCDWLKGLRPIPWDKEKRLKQVLKDYGYSG